MLISLAFTTSITLQDAEVSAQARVAFLQEPQQGRDPAAAVGLPVRGGLQHRHQGHDALLVIQHRAVDGAGNVALLKQHLRAHIQERDFFARRQQ